MPTKEELQERLLKCHNCHLCDHRDQCEGLHCAAHTFKLVDEVELSLRAEKERRVTELADMIDVLRAVYDKPYIATDEQVRDMKVRQAQIMEAETSMKKAAPARKSHTLGDMTHAQEIVRPGTIVRHFKYELLDTGTRKASPFMYHYEVIGVAISKSGKPPQVIYRGLYGDKTLYARDYYVFTGKVDTSIYPKIKSKYVFSAVHSPEIPAEG